MLIDSEILSTTEASCGLSVAAELKQDQARSLEYESQLVLRKLIAHAAFTRQKS